MDSRAVNLAMWNELAPAHAASPDYAFDQFVRDRFYLSSVIRFDLPRLGNLHGVTGLHLQCHIGTDTISLSRLGATMTGLDFSAAALIEARKLNDATGARVQFVEADVYDAAAALSHRQFDLVFTGIGALCWLPDIQRWAAVVSALLAPGGRLFLREGHPMMWAVDETRADRLLVVAHPYFQRDEPLISVEEGTYVETDVTFTNTTSHTFNHGLGEIVSALLGVGLDLRMLVEHDTVPWQAFPHQMVKREGDEWQLDAAPWRMPLTYTLQAVKPR